MRIRHSWNLRSFGTLVALSLLAPVVTQGCSGEDEASVSESSPDGPAGDGAEQVLASLELEASYPEGFSFLNGVREMADGTVLVADPLGQLLLRVDLATGTADTLGRVGPGPQEYQQPDQVFPLPGDSSLLVDLGKSQLTTVLPDGSFGDALPMMVASETGFPDILHPRFVDGQGNLFDQASRSRGDGPPDSVAITRFRRMEGQLDTVGAVWLPEYTPRRSRNHGYLPKMLQPRDDWAIGPDGSLVVVRAQDFSVEWHAPDGSVRGGPGQVFDPQEVSRANKEILLAEMRNSGISMVSMSTRSGGVQQMAMSRGLPNTDDSPQVDDFEWAETFPAFRPDRTIISPRGEAWVERWLPADAPTRWEVFDDQGFLLGAVELPPRYQLLGFGLTAENEEAAYLARSDEFELKWLERHRVVR